ncbi:C-X-C motif chemokine 2-like [Protopterus annectens]|uniref:C-X-C motif chemokine 2-like n=1 Tax=Protopterus annectens TaxID=7888 RepID=UPI001CF94C7A|nr:C-X-C motif chemokine 2-like [Protopterus annectens]
MQLLSRGVAGAAQAQEMHKRRVSCSPQVLAAKLTACSTLFVPEWRRNMMRKTCKLAVGILLILACTHLCNGAALGIDLRCHCIKTVSYFIPPKNIATIEIIPNGPHCSLVEVIATVQSGQLICLNPEARWVKMILENILSSAKQNYY